VSRPRRRVDWKAYDQFRAQFDGTKGVSAPLVRSIGMDPRNFAQSKRTRHRDEPPAAVNGADDANVDIPVNGNLPAIPASQPIAAHRGEPPMWVSRGGQLAADMLEVIDAYAQQHRLEKREVIDLFLRTGAAHLGEGVRHDG
jgi:hypothetical protein